MPTKTSNAAPRSRLQLRRRFDLFSPACTTLRMRIFSCATFNPLTLSFALLLSVCLSSNSISHLKVNYATHCFIFSSASPFSPASSWPYLFICRPLSSLFFATCQIYLHNFTGHCARVCVRVCECVCRDNKTNPTWSGG